ncbi:hypothetical protein L873DRAFT_1825028 [Choiromyces venosus 120613-1]|uniref:Urease accessory protein UreF n=1 Tax=Choiromyces venosus 120613-1 TaxID=1336337 RepID=A0A3N4KBF6_9PEZI|nr:hypothetical protein L873DRAFT_1825028 [Choiromyces venosus 120613-1]
MGEDDDKKALGEEIAELESRLQTARARLPLKTEIQSLDKATTHLSIHSCKKGLRTTTPETHFILLLSDSALPLGSFAFSSGLESYTAHRPATASTPRETIERFLKLSVSSLSHTTLPFVLEAHKQPGAALTLDDVFDASTICTVARRASVSQGRALLTVHEKSFASSLPPSPALETYRRALRMGNVQDRASGHFPVVYGVLCNIAGISLEETGYLFLLGHVKAVLSAAVRQSLIGPYHMQALLAAQETREIMDDALTVAEGIAVEDAGQSVPTLDLYQGRHELLYSRVFNS